ncbi:hypothetical protein G8767_34805 [Rhodococcus sp. IC4_135]|uniref:hypothetical protein n=1 Tax=Rhodococcus sp. IC4_135 TaxID=2715537 RepID=UPI001421D0AB|nr:hypothetical protein [Rhodococcus sp. IC4_135]
MTAPDPTVVHVHHHDIEAHAASFNEGYEAGSQFAEPVQTVYDEAVSLSYWLAKQLGEHVDDASDRGETLTDTVQRLIGPTRETLRKAMEIWPVTVADRDYWKARAEKAEATSARVREIRCGNCNNPLSEGSGNCVSDAGRPHIYDESDLRAALDGSGG